MPCCHILKEKKKRKEGGDEVFYIISYKDKNDPIKFIIVDVMINPWSMAQSIITPIETNMWIILHKLSFVNVSPKNL